uniref:Transmembrane protein n=1 Tax=Macrostomum lignano TaxID=282301 RepID=A0A1I8IW58_9PLAT
PVATRERGRCPPRPAAAASLRNLPNVCRFVVFSRFGVSRPSTAPAFVGHASSLPPPLPPPAVLTVPLLSVPELGGGDVPGFAVTSRSRQRSGASSSNRELRAGYRGCGGCDGCGGAQLRADAAASNRPGESQTDKNPVESRFRRHLWQTAPEIGFVCPATAAAASAAAVCPFPQCSPPPRAFYHCCSAGRKERPQAERWILAAGCQAPFCVFSVVKYCRETTANRSDAASASDAVRQSQQQLSGSTSPTLDLTASLPTFQLRLDEGQVC